MHDCVFDVCLAEHLGSLHRASAALQEGEGAGGSSREIPVPMAGGATTSPESLIVSFRRGRLIAPLIWPFVNHVQVLMEALAYVDVLFGNQTEATALATSEGWDGLPLDQLALKARIEPGAAALKSAFLVVLAAAA